MRIRALAATSIVALVASTGASLAQETMTDGLVTVNVAGSMVEVPVSIAAQACGMDAAAVIEASGMMNTDAKGADMVAAEPGTDAAADEVATEAAVGTGAATTETDAGTVSDASTDTAAADGGTTTEADQATDANSAGVAADLAMEAETATADAGSGAAAGGEMAAPTAVCEIDQATADQYGIPAAGETSGG